MPAQDRDGADGEGDRAATGLRLRRLHPEPMRHRLLDGALDPDLTPIEVEVTPPKAHELAATHPRRKQHHDGRKERRVTEDRKHRPDLVCGEDLHLAMLNLRRHDEGGWIAAQGLKLRRVAQGLVQNTMGMANSAGRQGLAFGAAPLEQGSVPCRDMGGSELLDGMRAEMGHDVVLDQLPITLGGLWTENCSYGRRPRP
jgi:hypothetical protein